MLPYTAVDLDDLEPLGELIGDARIVAIGENNHHIREFGEMRDRILRFLVERRGFTVLGFESGFAEGRLVDEWLHGGPGDVEDIGRHGFTFTLGESAEVREMLTWLRAQGGVRFAGLDVPGSGGSPLPALAEVRKYLEHKAPEAVSFVDEAIARTEPYSAASNALAPARYNSLEQPQRDAAMAALARLVAHLESLAPVCPDSAVALHHARGALRVDTYLRELSDLMAGRAPVLQSSSRDTYMAQTVRLLGDARIVLMVHNGHLQRVPVRLMPTAVTPSMGTHLAAELGDDYFALALTAGTGTTTGVRPDQDERLGFRVYEQPLDDPAPRSAEHALSGRGPSLVNLRALRSTAGPTSIRHAHLYSEVDVVSAFDALIYLPEMHSIAAR